MYYAVTDLSLSTKLSVKEEHAGNLGVCIM